MKRLILIATFLLSVSSIQAAPTFTVGAKDQMNPFGSWLPNGHTLYQSQPNRSFCWELSNLPMDNKIVSAVEEFYTPDFSTFNVEDNISRNKKHHTFPIKIYVFNGKAQHCWKFGFGDPVGKYVFKLTFDGVVYPTQEFTLKK